MSEITVDINEAGLTLREMVDRFGPRARVTVTDGGEIVGRFVLKRPRADKRSERVLGLNKGLVRFVADDFDAPLPDEFWLGGDP